MKKMTSIYKNGNHQWSVIARDPEKPNYLIDTNEYIITINNESLLTDPGGMEVFPAVFSAISNNMDPNDIKTLFASHQDPDIISSLSLWLDYNPSLKCHLSWLWSSFIPHFGGTDETFLTIPDEGSEISLGGKKLQAIPAHYLHSSGNFHLYDPTAKILFTGDVGAALIPHDEDYLFVSNFDKHIPYMEGFHRRWMGSNEAKNNWCDRAAEMEIDMLCPQHGAIFQGEDVARFIAWFRDLRVGTHK